MKRFWLGLGLLLALLAVGFLLSGRISRSHLPLAQKLTRAAEAARVSDLSLANSLLEEARQDWERNRNFAAAVTDHSPMEQIESFFAAAEYYSQTGDEAELAAACGRLAALTQALAESQMLSWWNLL